MYTTWISMMILMASASIACAGKLDLPSVLEATSKYADANVAVGDGYIQLPGEDCITAASLGADPSSGNLGKLLIHPDRLLPFKIDGRMYLDRVWTNWIDPGVLIYEPIENGGYKLVGVANVVSPKRLAWEGFSTAPVTEGMVWTLIEDDPSTAVDEAYGLEPHYTLRLWLFRDNPNGLHADFNPMVTCDAQKSSLN